MINLIKKINLSGIVIGIMLVSLFIWSIAWAQTEVAVSTDIPKELVSLAQDLGCKTSIECAEKFDANIEQGIVLAQKYDIYTPEQEKLATTFKTEVLERLRTVNQDNFEEEILALANKILSEKPALARTMGVTRQTVNAAETVINTIKDAGVDIRTCQKSPEDLSREQLIACVKASNNLSSKGTLVEDYIPKENAKAGEVEQMLELENSLLAGEYLGLGKISAEEAGQVCLKPGSESMSDCDLIAQKFFGDEGVKHLQEARQKATRIKKYYTQGIEKMELITPDGQKLIGKGAIRNACDQAFENSNLGLARACGNFAVKNGYATQEEIEDGLKIMETFSQKAEGVNFDDCRFNPESCREFLPDEFRSQFDSQFEIFKIMSESIGFDPMRCENTYDPDIGRQCLEGAKKALSQVEEIAKKSPEARRIVDEIRSHISEGERMTERRDEFHQDSKSGGVAGPGGCKGSEECFKYCSQPTNSAECISFGAKSQIFEQSTVVQKFNMVNERFNTLPGEYPGFTESGRKGFDYVPYPNQPDPRFQVDPGFNQYPYPPQQSVGPSPECFAAISSGDFVRAKTVCSSTTENYPKSIVEPFPVCPAYSMPSPCPEGQMRQSASDARGCSSFGACVVIDNYKPIDTPKPCPVNTYWDGKSCMSNPERDTRTVCPMLVSVNSCPVGQEMYVTYESNSCGKYYGCRNATTGTTCPVGQYWDGLACTTTTSVPRCTSDQWWDTITQSCKSSPIPTVGSCNYSTQYWKSATSQCMSRSNCSDMTNSEYNSQECQGVRGMTTPVSSGCGSFATQTTCQASLGCGWANGACGGNMTTSEACSAGQYWYIPPGGGVGYCMSSVMSGSCPSGYHSHGESGGFCMNDQENYSGTCYNSAGTSTITCPQQSYTPPMGGCGTYMTQASCTTSSFGCSWQNNACMSTSNTSNTSNTTCLSGQYWYTPPSGGTGYCKSTSTTDCISGQYWNGTACVANSTTSIDPSTGCAQAGGTWNSSTSYCQMPTTTTSCSSGQYWNGSTCVSSTTSGTYTPPPSETTTPPPSSYTPPPSETTTPPPSSYTPPSAMILCSQSGGNWTGAACNLAKNISGQKNYYNYYQKQSNSLLAQVFGAFVNLFK